MKHGTSSEVDPFSELIGRLRYQVEVAAHYIFGCSPEELTTRVGVAFIGPAAQPEFNVAAVPRVRTKTGLVDKRLRKVALGSGALSGGAPTKKKISTQAAYWARMTPKQRSREMAKRRAKWSTTALAKWRHKEAA